VSSKIILQSRSRFTTYQRDAESGLDYAMNRYYGNTSGRFMSPDQGKMLLYAPITLNRYLYSTDDPVNGNDPDGNFTCPACGRPPYDDWGGWGFFGPNHRYGGGRSGGLSGIRQRRNQILARTATSAALNGHW
jgi:RHS repeat-associated protein